MRFVVLNSIYCFIDENPHVRIQLPAQNIGLREKKQATLQGNQRYKLQVLARTQRQKDCSNISSTLLPPQKKKIET